MPNGYNGGNFMTQPKSQNEETRNNSTSFLENPNDSFSECIRTNVNQMRRIQEAGLTDLENQIEFASCHLVNVEIAIDSLLLKENNRM